MSNENSHDNSHGNKHSNLHKNAHANNPSNEHGNELGNELGINHANEHAYTQLVLRRGLEDLPSLSIPVGFELRNYQDGDEAAWEKIVGEMSPAGFVADIKSHRFFKPDKVKFICYGAKPVATAIAWDDEAGDEMLGMVHMVGADPEFSGKGLGYAVTNAVLHQMKNEGKSRAYLTTDDFRRPAINIYLKLGFIPDMSREGHKERWEKLYEQMKIGRK